MIEGREFEILNRNQNPTNPEVDLSLKFLNYDPADPDKKERKITKADVQEYVQDILQTCKKLHASKQDDVALAYIVESFLPEVLFSIPSLIDIDIDELKTDTNVALAHLREAFLTEIKIQIDANENFADLKTSDIFLSVLDATGANIVQKLVSVKRENFFLKQITSHDKFPEFRDQMTKGRKEFLELAQQDISAGKESPYILFPQSVSADHQNLLTPEIKMINLFSLKNIIENNIRESKPIDLRDFQIAIKAITDFARGCQYIQGKGFVLLDISIENIGYDLEHQQGVVSDLDGLAAIGSNLDYRLEKKELNPHNMLRVGTKVVPGEMVFQLGVAVKEFSSLGLGVFAKDQALVKIFHRLNDLCADMTNFNQPIFSRGYRILRTQPSMDKVIEELDKILQELNQHTNV